MLKQLRGSRVVGFFNALRSHCLEYCLLVMMEGVIPALADIFANGTAKGKENSSRGFN